MRAALAARAACLNPVGAGRTGRLRQLHPLGNAAGPWRATRWRRRPVQSPCKGTTRGSGSQVPGSRTGHWCWATACVRLVAPELPSPAEQTNRTSGRSAHLTAMEKELQGWRACAGPPRLCPAASSAPGVLGRGCRRGGPKVCTSFRGRHLVRAGGQETRTTEPAAQAGGLAAVRRDRELRKLATGTALSAAGSGASGLSYEVTFLLRPLPENPFLQRARTQTRDALTSQSLEVLPRSCREARLARGAAGHEGTCKATLRAGRPHLCSSQSAGGSLPSACGRAKA